MMDGREEGVKAIIYLQSLAGVVEPEERAAKNWDGFMDWEREQTLRTYRILKPEAEV